MIRKTPSKKQLEADRSKETRKKITISLAGILFLIGVIWAWNSYAKLRAFNNLKTEALALMDQPNSWEELRDLGDQAPWGYAQQFSDYIRGQYEERDMQRMRDFFAMSPEEQDSSLDRALADELRRDKEREQRDAARAASGNSGNSQRSGSGSGSGRNNSAGQGNNGSAGQDQGNPGGGFGRRDRTLSSRLDRGSPEGRSMHAAYRTMMNQRRAAAGLPPKHSPRSRF